jgi:hypothetical protein
MKNYYLRILSVVVGTTLLISCGAEDMDDKMSQEELKVSNATTVIEEASLYGTWTISVMQADTEVDLNADNVKNSNLLKEAPCLDTMNIVLNMDMTMSTQNSKLDLESGDNNNELACMVERTDFGTWSIESNVLTMNINIDGGTYTHKKEITMGVNSFSFDILKVESDQYVTDPGNTSSSSIQILSLTYSR